MARDARPDPAEDQQFEQLARKLATIERKPKAKAARSPLDSALGLDPYLFPPKDDAEEEEALFIRDFLQPGPGYAVDYGLVWEYVAKDRGEGQASIVDSRGTTGTFTRATTATTVDRTGKVVTVASGVPRFWYDPTTLAPLGYLAEGARTNFCIQSEAFNTGWTLDGLQAFGSGSVVNAGVAPDGNATADKIVEDATPTAQHRVYRSGSTVAGSNTASVWAKAAERSVIYLQLFNGTDSIYAAAAFDLSAGSTSQVTGTATITAYPNGWYRCTVTGTSTQTTSNLLINLLTGPSGSTIYSGDGTSGVYVWGAQLEQASFASTYIPTTTASVTRNADVLTYPIAPLMSPTQGTLLSKATPLAGAGLSFARVFSLNDGNTNVNEIYVGMNAGAARAFVTASSVTTASFNEGAWANGSSKVIGLSYIKDNVNSSFAGGIDSDDTSAAIPSGLTTLGVGCVGSGGQPYAPIDYSRLYNQRVPNAVLQAFTA